MSEPNPIGDSRDKAVGHMTLALTVAARFVEVHMHRRAEEARQGEQQALQAAREAQQQTRAEAAVVKYDLRDVGRKEWWDTAAVEQVAGGYAAARAYSAVDPELAGIARHMGEQIQSRYGIDAEQLVAANEEATRAFLDRGIRPPHVTMQAAEETATVVRTQEYVDSIDSRGVETRAANDPYFIEQQLTNEVALAMIAEGAPTRAELDEERRHDRAAKETTEAVALVAEANIVDAAVHADGKVTAVEAGEDVPRAEAGWDDGARHLALAGRLDSPGVPVEARETRLIADVAQATPAAAATAAAGQASGGAKRPQTVAQRVPERGRGR